MSDGPASGPAACWLRTWTAFMAANSGDLIAGVLPKLVNALAAVDEDVVLILDDFHYLQAAGLSRTGRVPDREPAGAGAPRHHFPGRPGAATGSAAGVRAAGRDPRRAAELQRRGGLRGPRAERVELSEPGVAQLCGADRGVAGRRLPRQPVLVRATGRRRARPRSSGTNRFVTSYFCRGGAQPGLRAGPGLHPHHVDPRPVLRVAVRRRRRHHRIGSSSWRTSSAEPVPGAARRGGTLVPFPPSVRRGGP